MGKEPLGKNQINKIIKLRRQGHSLPEIKKFTGHGSATVFKYIQNVEILPKFLERWENRKKSSVIRMIESQKKARAEAKSIVKDITSKDRLLISACLYWAEGNKKDFSLSNTDPVLIKTFLECLSEIGVEKDDIKVSIRVYEDIDQKEACKFWAKIANISVNKICSVNVLKGKKKGKLKYGMCRIRVAKGGYFLKYLKSIRDVVSEIILSPHSSTDQNKGLLSPR
jgi:hypothetical protein